METLKASRDRRPGYSLVVASLILLPALAATPSESWGAGVIHTPPRSIVTMPRAPLPPSAGVHVVPLTLTRTTPTATPKEDHIKFSGPQPPSAGTVVSNSATSGGPPPVSTLGSQQPSTITTASMSSATLAPYTTLTPSTTPTPPSAAPAFSQPPSTYTPTAPCPLGAPACASR
jgi:hypothetical protein